jgi:hypothetical protein
MKIIMITPAFPPIGGSHMQRVLNFANSLAEKNIELYVIGCDPSPSHPNLDYRSKDLIDKRIKVIYTPEGFLHRYTRVGKQANSSPDKGNNKKTFKSIMVNFGSGIKKKILIPDTMVDWYFSTMRYIRKNKIIEKIKPDVILSCSMPNTSHLIGYKLSKKYKIDLIQDYGDPWAHEISIKRGLFRFKLEYFLEREILKRASHITFATEATRDLYLSEYKLSKNKTSIAMMGFYEKDIINDHFESECLESSLLTMTYGGALDPVHRNPNPFFKALSTFSNSINLRIHMRVDDVKRILNMIKFYEVSNYVKVEGYIPFDEYIQEAKKSDVLILFGNSAPIQISGKLFNYMGIGARILYIKNMAKDEYDQTEEILIKYGNATIVQNDIAEISNVILGLLEEKEKKQIKRFCNNEILEFSWRNQGRLFAEAVTSAIKKNH